MILINQYYWCLQLPDCQLAVNNELRLRRMSSLIIIGFRGLNWRRMGIPLWSCSRRISACHQLHHDYQLTPPWVPPQYIQCAGYWTPTEIDDHSCPPAHAASCLHTFSLSVPLLPPLWPIQHILLQGVVLTDHMMMDYPASVAVSGQTNIQDFH